MRIIRFRVAILLGAALSGCATEASREATRTASITPNSEYKIIVIPVPIYLSNPDRGDEDRNSGEVVPPDLPVHGAHPQLLNLSEPDFHPLEQPTK
jgi:hypothetical protein